MHDPNWLYSWSALLEGIGISLGAWELWRRNRNAKRYFTRPQTIRLRAADSIEIVSRATLSGPSPTVEERVQLIEDKLEREADERAEQITAAKDELREHANAVVADAKQTIDETLRALEEALELGGRPWAGILAIALILAGVGLGWWANVSAATGAGG